MIRLFSSILSALGGGQFIAGLGLVAGLAGGVMWWSEHEYQAGRTEEREVWKGKEAIEAAEAQVRRNEIGKQHQEIIDVARQQASNAALDRDVAIAASVRLRKQLAAYVHAGRAASAAEGSPPAGDPIGVLADVLGRADQRAGELAEYADSARNAGITCERAYTALITRDDLDGGRLDH